MFLLLLVTTVNGEVCNFESCPADGIFTRSDMDPVSSCLTTTVNIPCFVTEVSPFLIADIRRVQLSFLNCSMSTVRWQAVFSPAGSIVDLSNCPLDCSCEHSWMDLHLPTLHTTVPPAYSCNYHDISCSPGKLIPSSKVLFVNVGDTVSLDVEVAGDILDDFDARDRQYFKWILRAPHNFTERISARRLQLIVHNASDEVLGVVRVTCWHCSQPLTTTIEIRIDSPLRVWMETADVTSSHLIVRGFPLENLTLSVEPADGATNSSSHVLETKKSSKYWDSLIVRPDQGHSMFHHRVFSVFTIDCSNCEMDHISGNYSFTLCNQKVIESEPLITSLLNSSNETAEESTIECRTIYHLLNYSNQTHLLLLSVDPTPQKRVNRTWLALLLLFVIGSTLFSIAFAARYGLLHKTRDKLLILRKRGWIRNDSRRTSRHTEETMLRLEERCSLSSSDYSGQIIPCIKGGTVQVHEKIGKGAFGEVYCGSWAETGERSVAVKAIPQADEEIEKEAQVLARLDHPNIVRLHGMTRDGDKLLLVFEMMNQGDLRSYLKARAPQASNYAQFPPALVEKELKFIVREIVKGLRYLGAQQIVHRDLAARNCLVSGKSDLRCCSATQRAPITVKISDFGMSRRLAYQTDYYRMQNQSLLPVRWLPPEAISEHRFSHSSDIWALGVTMWEVFSFGNVPFDTLSNHEVVSYALAGLRPPRPRGCPSDVYDVMQKCWALEPEERISAVDILLDPAMGDEPRTVPV